MQDELNPGAITEPAGVVFRLVFIALLLPHPQGVAPSTEVDRGTAAADSGASCAQEPCSMALGAPLRSYSTNLWQRRLRDGSEHVVFRAQVLYVRTALYIGVFSASCDRGCLLSVDDARLQHAMCTSYKGLASRPISFAYTERRQAANSLNAPQHAHTALVREKRHARSRP